MKETKKDNIIESDCCGSNIGWSREGISKKVLFDLRPEKQIIITTTRGLVRSLFQAKGKAYEKMLSETYKKASETGA